MYHLVATVLGESGIVAPLRTLAVSRCGSKERTNERIGWPWYLSYGEWPSNTVDHINGDPTDNRLCNLRAVSQQTNNRNLHKARRHNTVGVLGVTKFRNRYRARIAVDGVAIHLGVFKLIEDANAAYKAAKLNYHGDVYEQVSSSTGTSRPSSRDRSGHERSEEGRWRSSSS